VISWSIHYNELSSLSCFDSNLLNVVKSIISFFCGSDSEYSQKSLASVFFVGI